MGKYKSWKCGLCGDTVIEGQRFLVIKDIGFTHLECVVEKVSSRGGGMDRDLVALIDVNEMLTYGIVRLKQAELEAGSDDLRSRIASARKDLEKHSALLGNELKKYLG